MFEEKVQKTLCKIIKEYGINTYKEPSKLEGLLKDYCGECKKEIFMIVASAKDNIPKDIYESNIPIEMLKPRFVAKMIDNIGFQKEVSEDLVNLWLLVLEKITIDEYVENNKSVPEYIKTTDVSNSGNSVSQGTLTYPNAEYVGEIKDGEPHGQGTYTWASGEKYVGEFKDGKKNGQGTFTFYDGAKYIGKFKDGEYSGNGTFSYKDGSKYVGEWKNGKENGQGTLTYDDGSKYVGEFKDGEKNGQGDYIEPDGSKYVSEERIIEYASQLMRGISNKEVLEKIFAYSPSNKKTNEKFVNAITYYATLEKSEIPILCFDDTAFGSSKNGCLVTTRGIYIRNMMVATKFFKHIEIERIELRGFFNKELFVNDYEIQTVLLHDSKSKEILDSLLTQIVNDFK